MLLVINFLSQENRVSDSESERDRELREIKEIRYNISLSISSPNLLLMLQT